MAIDQFLWLYAGGHVGLATKNHENIDVRPYLF